MADLKAGNVLASQLAAAEKELAAVPNDEAAAVKAWTAAKAAAEARNKPLAGMPRHGQIYSGDPNGDPAAQASYDNSRRNFLALIFCLMVGTAALPHILMRYYTTPSVKEARQSVTWSLFFIFLLYFTAPALAVLVKYEMFSAVVGASFDSLPYWISAWNKVDPALLSVVDVNKDGLLQLGELKIGGDIVVLATPAIGGLPYVISGLVAAGGLAAALSTADGLLLTIANALSHDLYYKMIDPNAPTARRVTLSKVLLLVVALMAAAFVAAQKPADILFLVSAAFSLAAAAFFPALACWASSGSGRPASGGRQLGMVAGPGRHVLLHGDHPALAARRVRRDGSPIADQHRGGGSRRSPPAAVGRAARASLAIIVVSLLTPAPTAKVQELVEHVRYPNLTRTRAA